MKKIFKFTLCLVMLLIGSIIFGANVFASNGNISDLHSQTLLNSYVNDSPAITILTPGQGSDESTFSNYNDDLVYDSSSLIETLRIHAYADVYLADMKANTNDSTSFKDFDLYLCEKGDAISGTNYYDYVETPVDTIRDFSKHAVIIFGQYYCNEYHDVVYRELDSLIDSISYDYKMYTGKLPKVNLIGHSRGGLINLIYATNHPYNVSSLISMGTPYSGSAFSEITSLISAIGLSGAVNCNSGQDILNTSKQAELRNNWNTMLSNNPNANINAVAIGSCTSSDYLEELFAGGYVDDELYYLLGIDPDDASFFEKVAFFMVSLAANGITQYINEHPEVVNGIFRVVDFGMDIANFFSDDTTVEEREKIQSIFNNCYLDYGELVIRDDLFIDYQSQIASGYNGFQVEKKIFSSDNTNYSKVSQVNVPIPHNLEARDTEIISIIMSELTYGSITTNMGNVLPDEVKTISNRTSAVKYTFTPFVSSKYKLNCSNNNLTILVQDTNSYTTSECDANDLVKLEANKTYDIYIHNNGTNYNSNFSIGFPSIDDFVDVNYTLSSYENTYITIQESSNKILKYKTNNNNIKIEVLNSSYQSLTDNTETVSYYFNANQKYYLKINNTKATTQSFNLTQESLDVIIYNSSLSTTIGSDYSYFKFVAPSTNTFVFNLTATVASNFSPNVEMYSSSYSYVQRIDSVNTKNGNLYSIPLTEGETIYIGIKNMIDNQQVISISADISNYYWTVDGIIDDDRIVNMNRSGNDKIRVSYYCNGQQLKGNLRFESNFQNYFMYSEAEDGYAYDITLKLNANLNLDGASYLSFYIEAFEGDIAFTTQRFDVSVDPYIDINLTNTSDVYDYSVIIDVDASTMISGESITVALKMKNKNNNSVIQSFTSTSFSSAKLVPPSTYYKSGNLEISIYSVTFTYGSNSKTYYIDTDTELFEYSSNAITKKGLIQEGDGTSSSPYLISSFRELNNIREFAVFDSYYESYYIKGYFKLTADITISGAWQPIETCFKGNFNGNSKTISNISMTITSSNSYYGLFRSTDNATFSNLNISNVNVYSGSNSGNVCIGAICGFATYSDFTGCMVKSGTMGASYNNYASSIGGLVGFSSHSDFTNCTAGESTNKLYLYSYGSMGGIAGTSMGGSFSNCKNNANLYHYWDGSNNRYTGGIVGKATISSSFTNCKNYGLIKFSGSQSDSKELAPYMGQIIGYKDSTVTLSGSTCSGTCNYDNLRKVGGFLGIGKTNQGRYASTGEYGYSE